MRPGRTHAAITAPRATVTCHMRGQYTLRASGTYRACTGVTGCMCRVLCQQRVSWKHSFCTVLSCTVMGHCHTRSAVPVMHVLDVMVLAQCCPYFVTCLAIPCPSPRPSLGSPWALPGLILAFPWALPGPSLGPPWAFPGLFPGLSRFLPWLSLVSLITLTGRRVVGKG